MTKNNITTKVYLIRHGITDWIEQGYVHGKTDRPLSAFGLAQAELTGKAMQGCKAAHLYVSPLQRALQTAEPISRTTGLKIELVDDLQEMDFGIIEGTRNLWPILRDRKLLLRLYFSMRRVLELFSGETFSHFKQRVLHAWEAIRGQADGRPIIIVAHAGVLRVILQHEFKAGAYDPRYNLDACSISILEIDSGAPTRDIQINGIAHLNGKVRP
jgi:broad specificity phosphatase PhoE